MAREGGYIFVAMHYNIIPHSRCGRRERAGGCFG